MSSRPQIWAVTLVSKLIWGLWWVQSLLLTSVQFYSDYLTYAQDITKRLMMAVCGSTQTSIRSQCAWQTALRSRKLADPEPACFMWQPSSAQTPPVSYYFPPLNAGLNFWHLLSSLLNSALIKFRRKCRYSSLFGGVLSRWLAWKHLFFNIGRASQRNFGSVQPCSQVSPTVCHMTAELWQLSAWQTLNMKETLPADLPLVCSGCTGPRLPLAMC